jgi:hypothetical protein
MSKRLQGAEETTHTTFSLYPSEISSFRFMAKPFGSIGRAVQVAVEVLYDRAQRGILIDIEEVGPPDEVIEAGRDSKQLKSPMSCDLLGRTSLLIDELAKPKRYGGRYWVLCAALIWLNKAHAEEQKRKAAELERKRKAEFEKESK